MWGGGVRIRFKPVYVAYVGVVLLFVGVCGILYVVADVDHKGVFEVVHGSILAVSIALVALGSNLFTLYLCMPDDL